MIPAAKLIVLLRNPVDRAYSHHDHAVRMGFETLPFERAIASEEERLDGEGERILEDESYNSYNHQHHSYLSRGIYVDQLQTWAGLFPKERILILRSEDFFTDPKVALAQVLRFLELPPWEPNGYKTYNAGSKSKLDDDVRRSLIDFFKPHNARLYDYLGEKLRWDK
jgi:hypothetical protein